LKPKVAALLEVARGRKQALLITHDNPDPDAIASAWALAQLLEERSGVVSTLAYGGLIGRAENRAMVRQLKIPVQPIHRLKPQDYDLMGLVDTQPDIGNHSLPPGNLQPIVCVDHHPLRPETALAAFHDVGGEYGATSTKITGYLRAAGVTPRPAVATALFYGIKSDTRDLGRLVGPMDVDTYAYLIPMTDMPLVSAIEHPQVPVEYFQVLVKALRNARLHGQVATVDLGAVYIPDIVAEMADRLMSIEGVKWGLATGEHEGELYLSVRVNDKRMRCGTLLRTHVEPLKAGSAGGHGAMAGARIDLERLGKDRAARVRKRKRLLDKLIKEMGGTREFSLLLPRRRRVP
jgi:nanoRNase/pAp phosphatase (c-di-AMP/oligoRNAs hydrolase)